MKLNFIKSQSSVKPDLVDTTSSKTSVYLRKDIAENTITDMDGNEVIMYEYDEAVLTKAEYEEYLKELEVIDIQQQRADIDYILMMTGLEASK